MKLFSLLAICLFLTSIQCQSAACLNCLDRDIEPVCGVDGVTYINNCQRRRCVDDIDLAYEGPCKCNCTAEPLDPVCATNGITYRNECAVKCSGLPIEIDFKGVCPSRCNCQGTYGLVCGVDGRTY